MKDNIRKQYELACKYGVDERVIFYRLMFGGGEVVKYLQKCIKKEEKLLKQQDYSWVGFEGDIKNLLNKKDER